MAPMPGASLIGLAVIIAPTFLRRSYAPNYSTAENMLMQTHRQSIPSWVVGHSRIRYPQPAMKRDRPFRFYESNHTRRHWYRRPRRNFPRSYRRIPSPLAIPLEIRDYDLA